MFSWVLFRLTALPGGLWNSVEPDNHHMDASPPEIDLTNSKKNACFNCENGGKNMSSQH